MKTRDKWGLSVWMPGRGGLAAILIVAVMSVRILQTHKVFSGTFDEGMHLTAGIELFALHRYTSSPMHPPLARIAAAVGPWIAGARYPAETGYIAQVSSVMRSGPGYRKNLELARLGILPFFVASGLFLFLWTRRIAGEGQAVVAVGLLSLTPPVLAHSGLVTTDAAAMATFTALVLAFQLWLEQPHSLRKTVWLGLATGAAVASKLSAIPFFGATAALLLLVERTSWRRSTLPKVSFSHPVIRKHLVLAALIALMTLYATYGFTLGRSLGFPAPLSDFVLGLMLLIRQNIEGKESYLLGETYLGRRLLFFPVAVAVKTPIPLLLLAIAGAVLALRQWWRRDGLKWFYPLAACSAPLAVACLSKINLGVRHVLPIFPAMCALGGIGGVWLWRFSRVTRGLVAFLGVWLVVGTWRAHPDYIAYFNEFVADDPGAVLVESDLDWGQDLERLSDTVRSRGISELSIAYFGFPDRLRQLFPNARVVGPQEERPDGWFAVSETRYRRGWPAFDEMSRGRADSLTWLRSLDPVTRVGSSIRLYFIPSAPDSQGRRVR